MADKFRDKIHQYFLNKSDFLSVKDRMNEKDLQQYIHKAIKEVARQEDILLSSSQEERLLRELTNEFISLGPLRPLIEDKSITEIMINGPKRIYVERGGCIEQTNISFDNEQHLMHTIQKIITPSGRRVDESSPYVDFSLTDGSRVNIILPPVSLIGPVVTIRKFSAEIDKIEELIKLGSMDQKIADFLVSAIKARLNIVFSGATGVGKTTTLNVLSRYIPANERIITIEDTSELRLFQEHVVSLQTRPSNVEGRGEINIRDIFKNSLRMCPDRIIVGEIRGAEALDMIQAISSGHTGSLAIVHANSPFDVLLRLETMILMSGINLSLENIRRQIANALDLIVHMEQAPDGSRKITYITEIRDLRDSNIALEDIVVFEYEGTDSSGKIIGKWVYKKPKPLFLSKFNKLNVKLPEGIFS
ncbi:MAG: CpaF family protein [Candidatus Omnitrophota bacterium]|nr:CpaF family protein [Candidatus Omnitrophota bacterium]